MLLKLLIELEVKNVFIAGLDGYSMNISQNFADNSMSIYANESLFAAMNNGINQVIREYSKKINIVFLTQTRYISLP